LIFVYISQIEKYRGEQVSAESLTWSYANILHALYVRKITIQLQEEVLEN
jgi:GH15 family glucan-1,4-alpha-glucosidase